MDLYSSFGKPLQVTEVTIPAYSNSEKDEALQAEIIEKLYSIWFSHPNMEQIIYWNLVDGYAHVETDDQAVIDASQGDMTIGEKADQKVLHKLFLTNDDLIHLHRQEIHKGAFPLNAVVQFFYVYAFHKYDF